jgi:hypothetical protein
MFIKRYYTNKVKKFLKAKNANDVIQIKKICHQDCKFIGFKDNEGTLESFLKHINRKSIDNKIEIEKWKYNFGYIYEYSFFKFKLAKILKIDAHQKCINRYAFKGNKIIEIKNILWHPRIDQSNLKIWNDYINYIKQNHDINKVDIMNDINIAEEFMLK